MEYTPKHFNPDFPIIIGLCGQAGVGKTSTADGIVPSLVTRLDPERELVWDHTYFALPLYQMASIKRKTEGNKARDRVCYALHELLAEVLGSSPLYGAPPYDDLCRIVSDVTDMYIPMDPDIKPRAFLQDVGTLCREWNQDCFVNYTLRKINQRFIQRNNEDGFASIAIISDVRMENEAAAIANSPNGMVIKLEASYETRMDRLMRRDGTLPDHKLLDHATERIDLIPEEYFARTIDTDGLSVKEQVALVESHILHERGFINA